VRWRVRLLPRHQARTAAPKSDLRIPQICTLFRPAGDEAGSVGDSGQARGSRWRAKTNHRLRGFFGNCEIVPPELSNPRVAGSSPAGVMKSTELPLLSSRPPPPASPLNHFPASHEDRSANGTSASDGRAGRITRSTIRDWSGWTRPDRGGAEELPTHAQGRICLVGADRP
jgi:hypothetical protein